MPLSLRFGLFVARSCSGEEAFRKGVGGWVLLVPSRGQSGESGGGGGLTMMVAAKTVTQDFSRGK